MKTTAKTGAAKWNLFSYRGELVGDVWAATGAEACQLAKKLGNAATYAKLMVHA